MDNRILIGAITAVVVVVMLGSVLMPVIDDATTGKSESNPDAGWIRMNYDTAAGSTYTVTITPGDDGITVANGTDTQTGSDDTIFYADSNVAVWMQDGTVNILGQNTDGPQFLQPEEAITVTRTAEGVTVASGGDSLSFAAPAWAYVPFSSGSYGYFTDGTAVKTNSPIAAVGGGFAGVYAYNDITRYAGLGLQLQTVMEDGKLTGAYWEKAAAADTLSTLEPFDPSIIDLDPIDLGGGSSAGLMSVPTPQHTDGDWGYNIIQVDGVSKAAIVSYSGSGGDIVVPATIGGYDVQRIGKNPADDTSSMNNEVFDNTSISQNSTVTISDGIKEIGSYAFYKFANMTDITIPDSVVSIGRGAFYQSGLTSIVMPDSITFIGNSVLGQCVNLVTAKLSRSITTMTGTFYNDTNLESVILPPSLTKIGGTTFYLCQKLSNIGIPGVIAIPDTVTEIGIQCFANNVIFTSVVIPASVTTIGSSILLGCTGLTSVIIASDATPGGNFGNSSNFTNVTEILDLSDTVDYSVDRYNLPATATVQDNIGDSVGYLGVAELNGPSPLGSGATAILMAVPVLVIFSLIVAALVIFLKRSY